MSLTPDQEVQQALEILKPLTQDPRFHHGVNFPGIGAWASEGHPGWIVIRSYFWEGKGRGFIIYLHPSEVVSLDAIKLRLLLEDLPRTAKEAWKNRTHNPRRRP